LDGLVTIEPGRVTRLGEFSPIGYLITFRQFFLNYRSSRHFWTTYLVLRRSLCITSDKKRVGLHFGRFFP
jgi:hypothetical protein